MLSDIPPSPRGIPQIEVTFDIDANGIISVSAQDKTTGKQQNIRIESGNKLSDDEIQKMKDDAVANEKADQERLKISQLKNEADSISFQAEKMLKDMSEKITEEEKKEIEDLVKDLREKTSGENLSEIESSMKSLFEKVQTISSRVYSEESKEEPVQENPEQARNNAEAEEVEFEEVKG
jgi:molecular chaperone DnaK